jgi:hypothetical protein
MSKDKIEIVDSHFQSHRTTDIFKIVKFIYNDDIVWDGALPTYLVKKGLELSDEAFDSLLEDWYECLEPAKRNLWIENEKQSNWGGKGKQDTSTYKVFNALSSGNWECRKCGPVNQTGSVQPAARIRDLKDKGYIICSQKKMCSAHCQTSQVHDILIMIPMLQSDFQHGNNLRKPISETLQNRIKNELGRIEVCFSREMSNNSLVIDHKFPSQRWNGPESANPDDMALEDIKKKFQLLTNQANAIKSRNCESCVKDKKRGVFMGIKWYYVGDENWNGDNEYDEKGCIGCPWYDLEKWKTELLTKLNHPIKYIMKQLMNLILFM